MLLFQLVSFSTSLSSLEISERSSTAELSPEETQRRVQDINASLSSIKKWQGQYSRKQKSYQGKASRLLFKNSTESRQYKEMAEDAKQNAQALQVQIDQLIAQKDSLISQTEN